MMDFQMTSVLVMVLAITVLGIVMLKNTTVRWKSAEWVIIPHFFIEKVPVFDQSSPKSHFLSYI